MSGIFRIFAIQFELAWKVLKELLTYEGIEAARTGSPREIIKQAYQYYPCIQEDVCYDEIIEKYVEIKVLLKAALTDEVGSREVYVKSIYHSYYYEGYTTFKAEEL